MDSLIFELQIVFSFQLFLSANVRHSFVLKHNLSKAAWADLLRLRTALVGEWCRRTFLSTDSRPTDGQQILPEI